MIISELINKLQEFPIDTKVLGTGYESGYEDIKDVELQELFFCPENPRYEGTYQNDVYGKQKNNKKVKAVTLS